MTPAEIVHRFATLTGTCLDHLLSEYKGLERRSIMERAVLVPRVGSAGLSDGQIGSLGRFLLHGTGCRFELDSGEVLDVDWNVDGTAEFDTWRMLMFAKSMGEETVDLESLRLAADADPLLRRTRDGWFTWVDRRYDLHRGRTGHSEL